MGAIILECSLKGVSDTGEKQLVSGCDTKCGVQVYTVRAEELIA